jgi:hypothetical protein
VTNQLDPCSAVLTEIVRNATPEQDYQSLAKSGAIPTQNTDALQHTLCTLQCDLETEGWLVMVVHRLASEVQSTVWRFVHEDLNEVVVNGVPTYFSDTEKKLLLNIITMWVALNFFPYRKEPIVEGMDPNLVNTLEYLRGLADRMFLVNALQFRAVARSVRENERPREKQETPPHGGIHDDGGDDEEVETEQRT